MTRLHQSVVMIGFGAIGQSVARRMAGLPGVDLSHVVVSKAKVGPVQSQLNGMGLTQCHAVDQVPDHARLVLECAGHSALRQHILPALARGVECAILSIGALSEPGLPEALQAAAEQGQTQLHLLGGAVGGIDAVASARQMGIDEVIYTGRKPPQGWRGSPAEALTDLAQLTSPLVILQGSAREAARLYPKNANVAATLSLAGIGLDRTQVRLIADPGVKDNIHEFEVRGPFGELHMRLVGKPLPDNPKTSTLTVLSALRFLHNRVSSLSM
jgi:aspartate dehydrogenase